MNSKRNGILYTENSDEIFSNLPGLVLWEDNQQRFLGLNQLHSVMLGFKSIEASIGKTVFDMPCKASELAETFAAEQKEILETGSTKTFFGIIGFNNEYKAMLTAKKPLVDSTGNIVGLFIQGFEVTSLSIMQIANHLIGTDKKHRPSTDIKQFEYEVIDQETDQLLTQREIECLFFLIRGKSAKEIARLLNISYRTVEHHFEKMRGKLNCKTKTELICKAFENNYSRTITHFILKRLGSGDLSIS